MRKMGKSRKYAKYGSIYAHIVIDTSRIPKVFKVKTIVQNIIDEWVKAGCPANFKIVVERKTEV